VIFLPVLFAGYTSQKSAKIFLGLIRSRPKKIQCAAFWNSISYMLCCQQENSSTVTRIPFRRLRKIDRESARRVIRKLKEYLLKDPAAKGVPLKGIFRGLYRFRIEGYRLIFSIDREEKTVTIYKIDHRKQVYKEK